MFVSRRSFISLTYLDVFSFFVGALPSVRSGAFMLALALSAALSWSLLIA